MSIAIGFGTVPLSLLTRFVTRACFGVNVPRQDADQVDMDIGYGAVVRDAERESTSEPPTEDLHKAGTNGKELQMAHV